MAETFHPELPPFTERVRAAGAALRKTRIEVLQVNVGKLCNQICQHCHVDAGPMRSEIMKPDTAEACLRFLAGSDIPLVDITGGAPELCPEFDRLVLGARALGRRVMDRCNLTVLFEPGKAYLPGFFRDHQVELVCSLPCYSRENVERQRGTGVFDRSIEALRMLNDLGYGRPGSGLTLDLVYNPVGTHLPPPQAALEADYRKALSEDFGIAFSHLITITNMPIARFGSFLRKSRKYDEYMHLLSEHFNAATLDGLMCRSFLSVGWEGTLYDCDFNQMLELPIPDRAGRPRTIFDAKPADFERVSIIAGDHCYGCTAGAGSGCGGAITQ